MAYDFDVFLSHSHKDEDWVRIVLLPVLYRDRAGEPGCVVEARVTVVAAAVPLEKVDSMNMMMRFTTGLS